MVPFFDLPFILWDLFRSLTGRGRTSFEIRQWAEQRSVEIVALRPCGRPPNSVAHFPQSVPRNFRFFQIAVIDSDHVRRSGVARVHDDPGARYDSEPLIDFVWLTAEQLDWRDRPPRRSAELPHDRAEGWYTDPTGAHELRWYSVASPTDLVRDGTIESRDPPAPLAEFCD